MTVPNPSHFASLLDRLKLGPGAFAIVVSGPSGVGKSTICKALVAADAGVRMCVTTTTRPGRNSEEDGVDYHFVTEAQFQALLDAGEMVEWAEVHGHRYGASLEAVARALADDRVMLLDIDVQGAETWKHFLGDRCVRVFVLPPSMGELSDRLKNRRTEGKESFETRMRNARTELAKAPEYDYVVVNRDLDHVIQELMSILVAERRRPGRFCNLLERFGE